MTWHWVGCQRSSRYSSSNILVYYTSHVRLSFSVVMVLDLCHFHVHDRKLGKHMFKVLERHLPKHENVRWRHGVCACVCVCVREREREGGPWGKIRWYKKKRQMCTLSWENKKGKMRLFALALIFKYHRPIILMWAALLLVFFFFVVYSLNVQQMGFSLKAKTNHTNFTSG